MVGLPTPHHAARLCDTCRVLEIWRVAYRVQFKVDDLKKKAPLCDLCNLLWKICVKGKGDNFQTISFSRTASWLRMNEGEKPALFLYRDPAILEWRTPTDLQIGLPVLSGAGSQAQFEVMRQWLTLCDQDHPHDSQGFQRHRVTRAQHEDTRLPTRLIDVGVAGQESVKLWETTLDDRGKYMALSHPWGQPPHFCTYRSNISDHKHGIALEQLPTTFRDAILTTRGLGIRFLWIDSICIIQGPDGDFNTEAKRMDQVFSGAYCVIAASSSLGQRDGFLKPRNEREYVSLQHPGQPPYYVCENIDDFNFHVLESPLNGRGWVLQEHALARRTIFFSKYQAYWECGEGVRCETGTRMTNSLAAFLGDTKFPQIIMSASKGERILRYQDLYRNYSRLGLTWPKDRPVAIDGLQSRLLDAFDTEGNFGIFDEGPQGGHLRRSLLWHRGNDVPHDPGLVPITFSDHSGSASAVPSWSWMAYSGGIDYLKLEFNGVEWMELKSPWTRVSWGNSPSVMPGQPGGVIALGGKARTFDVGKVDEGEICLIYDKTESLLAVECVVLGIKQEGLFPAARRNYVLLVAPTPADGKTWRRVGVGYLPGSCISETWSSVVIV